VLLAAELKRKAIHLASLVIPLGYFASPASWYVWWERALLASVILSLAIEVFRLNHPRTRHVFRHFFGELLRNHEEATLLGSTYLLIACLLSIHLFPKPVAVLALSFLILGDTHRTLRPMRQVRLREFEAPMAGAFYVTGFLEEIGRHYEIGKEIVCYRSIPEMVDLCRHYLAHDEERERIRRAGHERARRDHTWTKRFEGLFAELSRRGTLRR